MSLPEVPPQLRNFSGSWFTIAYNFLVELIAALAGIGGGGTQDIIYRPDDATNPAAGIYGDFPSAFAAWILIPGCTMRVDGSLAGPVVPSGAYAFPAYTLTMEGMDFETLLIEDGAVFASQSGTQVNLVNLSLLADATTTTPFPVSTNFFVLSLVSSFLNTNGPATVPMFTFSGTGLTAIVALADSSAIQGGLEAPIFHAAAGINYVQVNVSSSSEIDEYAYDGPGLFNTIVEDQSVIYSANQNATNFAWVLGGGTVVRVVGAGTNSSTGGTYAKITNWTISENDGPTSGSGWDAPTSTFTTPVPAFFNVEATIEYGAIASAVGGQFKLAIFKNNVIYRENYVTCETAGANVSRMVSLSTGIDLAQGDVIDFRAAQTSGSGEASLSGVASRNFFNISC